MSCDLRYDPIFGIWTCIAEQRQTRPVEFQQLSQRRAGIDCPFCRGNESVTPQAVSQWDQNGIIDRHSPDWLVRVLPNKYPAFATPVTITSETPFGNLVNRTQPGSDPSRHRQEVIVISPRHLASLSGLSDPALFSSFQAFQNRVAYHSVQDHVKHVCLFMNCRALAGASIEHAHFQLIASPVCTEQVHDRVTRMSQSSTDPERTMWQSQLDMEIQDSVRVIETIGNFFVFCPFASRFPNQIRIAFRPASRSGPKETREFSDIDLSDLYDLAKACRRWVDGLERCLDDPAYNLIFHFPPTPAAGKYSADWFVDIVPRFPQAAGFELATECWVNPVSPETAAEQFRRFANSG